MPEEKKPVDKSVWVNSAISSRLLGNEYLKEYGDKIVELKEIASKVAPEGRVVILLSNKEEKFRPFDKLGANIALSKSIYNERGITTNPEIGGELGEILVLVNQINKIFDKRKAKSKNRK